MSSQSDYTLEAGLNALKGGDNQAAKTILEFVAQNSPSPWMSVQAQIGLVVACARLGEIEDAIALCELLLASNRTEVKAWAVGVRRILQTRQSLNQQQTGFVPTDSPPESFDVLELAVPPSPQSSRTNQNSQNINTKTQQKSVDIPKQAGITWRNAGRAKTWQTSTKFPQSRLWYLWGLEVLTLVAIVFLLQKMVDGILKGINHLLVISPWLEPIQLFYADPRWLVVAVVLILTIATPWLLDIFLSLWYGTQTLQLETLQTASPESVRIIQRYIQPQKISPPKLWKIPTTAPLIFTYGHLPRTTRIVISQGLLDTLTDGEIAVLVASKLLPKGYWDMAVVSFTLTLTLPIYQLYLGLANWSDKTIQPIFKSAIAALSSLVYLIWCLFTGTTIWLNRVRLEYGDAIAINTTGNPNALIRALLKIAIGIAHHINTQGCTPGQLESLNIAAPVSFQQSITIGSLAPQISWESILMWDYLHPYRHWFTINNTHPLLGCRIQTIAKIARNLRLDPELEITSPPLPKISTQQFLLQIAPFCLSIPFGLLMAGLFGAAWQIAFALKIINLKWIYDNWNFVTGCILIGFSLGTLIRIEQMFPDIKPNSLQTHEHIATILTNPTSLPIQPTNIQLQGKLLGRAGSANHLGQDLILNTHNTLIKLHHIPRPGYPLSIQTFIGRQVTVVGWLRRGATPWIDIQSIHTQSRQIPNIHPIWSYMIAFSSAVWGAVILLRGY